jgi:hypothetical protein
MKAKTLNDLENAASLFISYLQLETPPNLIFEKVKGVQECKTNASIEKNTIWFNTWFLNKLSFDFAVLIVLHEIFHFSKQGIKTQNEVAEMRYGYLWPFMQLYDIEADLFVIAHLQDKNIKFTFDHYLKILYREGAVFKNTSIRQVKLERFIGSLVSIKLFYKTNTIKLYLPKIYLNSLTLISVHFDARHLKHECFEFPTEYLELWKKVYQDCSNLSETEYVDLINRLIDKFCLQIINPSKTA